MNTELQPTYRYQIGGSLPPDSSTYVVRQADSDLFNALLAGEYCYVLNSRQMGKSSLRIRTMDKLQAQGIVCAEIELTGIGSQQITAQQWYGGIIQELISGFELPINRRHWLRDREDLSPVQRLSEFIETLLQQIPKNIVIFIDEIDSILSLNFLTDEFFALIRNCYNQRASKPDYKRLTFALLGVATPSDLIQDKNATPFNIGRAIELRGFQFHESGALVAGLVGRANHPQALLKEILYWTGGQPFLTQKLCWLIAQSGFVQSQEVDTIPPGEESKWVKQFVQKQIVEHWEAHDDPEHLKTIRDRILRNARNSEKLLLLCQQILQHGKIAAINSDEQMELRLSGIVTKQEGYLRVYNPIYESVFNLSWVSAKLIGLRTSPIPVDKATDKKAKIPEDIKEIQPESWNNPPEAIPISPIPASESQVLPVDSRQEPWWWVGLRVLIASAIATSLVLGVRSRGGLESWELQVFDHLMRLQPQEEPDERLLIVEITEKDVQAQPAEERVGASLSDRAFAQLLAKLESYQPQTIGLDIYRDRPVEDNYPELAQAMETSDRLFTICHYGNPGVIPPPEVSGEQQGFNNVILDADDILRRHLLAVTDASPCQNQYAFSIQVAGHYLADQGIESHLNSDGYLQLGSTVFKTLEKNTGGYSNIDSGGHQILLNYRATNQIAETITLTDFLNDQLNPEQVKNRIVLIGTTAPSFNDHRWFTPYSKGKGTVRTMTGIEIQAQMVSQILSAVLDQRSLIWWWSEPIEILWICGWSLIGGLLAQNSRSPRGFLIRGGVAIAILYGSGWVLFLQGGWIPLVPAALALVMTGGMLIVLSRFKINP
ncbi:MAG: CHASE2 domain-containing protein [Coleofasciculus chthonoplastes F3-SA18-01]|uniref:CHASE2 domain-containing protein n=1 Tax=Coleofasciculus chthonoplastes TaxID=64178 RepID=UPI00330551F1